MDLVVESGGDTSIERRFANFAGLPVRRLPRYLGSVVGWENAALPGTTAFVVELSPQPLAAAAVARFSRAVLKVER